MGTDLVPYCDVEKMGRAISASKLFGLSTPEQAVALMLIAQAEGLHPAIAARDYHIIQGRPALKADAMMARFQGSGGKVQWTELTDTRVAAVFSHPSGGSVEIDWTMERAKKAELGGKDMWRKFPRQMLRARVISEGIRTVYPGCLVGFYTPEEVIDMEPLPATSTKSDKPVEQLKPVDDPACKRHDDLDQRGMQEQIAIWLDDLYGESWPDVLETLTTFETKDGKKVAGKRSPFELGVKPNPKGETRTSVTYLQVRDEWTKRQEAIGGMAE